MALTQTEIQTQVIELSTEALKTFCNDISGMFGVSAECKQQQIVTETVKGLEKRFEKLAAVNTVKAEGTLDGIFKLLTDREGLFVLTGVITMMPEKKISEKVKHGSPKDAEDMSDAVEEVGNLMVDSWDKIFHGELNGHECFAQIDTFIGNPWDKPKKKIDLADDEEFVFVPYEITVGPYKAFNCGVIFSKKIFEPASIPASEQAAGDKEKNQKKAQEQKADVQKTTESTAKKDAEGAIEADPKKVESVKNKQEAKSKTSVKKELKAATKQKSKEAHEDTSDDTVEQPISDTIRKMTKSSATLLDEQDTPAIEEKTTY
ncbi:MAG: hypothetical protein ACYS8Y_09625, partial [Planctomycetota bacterium]